LQKLVLFTQDYGLFILDLMNYLTLINNIFGYERVILLIELSFHFSRSSDPLSLKS